MKRVFTSLPDQRDIFLKRPHCSKLTLFPWILNQRLRENASEAEKEKIGENDLGKYIQACEDSFEAYMLNIMLAIGYIPDKSGLVLVSDTTLVPHVMQYIEQVIQRFDRDKDGVLDNDEALRAYPVFKKTLQDVSGYDDDKTLRGLLAYFMAEGKPPETLFEKAYFYLVFRNRDSSTWNIQTDRSKLAKILSYISTAMSSSTTALIGDDPSGETQRRVTPSATRTMENNRHEDY